MIATLPNLTRLHLQHTEVGDGGVALLAALQRLEYLNLYGTAVTDEGLVPLSSLKRLRALYVWETGVTPAGISRLQAALPRLTIETGAGAVAQTRQRAVGFPHLVKRARQPCPRLGIRGRMAIGVKLAREPAKRRLQFRREVVGSKVLGAGAAQRLERVVLGGGEPTPRAFDRRRRHVAEEECRVGASHRRHGQWHGEDAGRRSRRRRPGPAVDQAIEHVGEVGGRHPSGIGVPADA